MTLVRRPVSSNTTQAKDEEARNDTDDTIVVPHDLPDDTEEDVGKPDHKPDHDEGKAVTEKEVVLEAMQWGLVPWFTKPEDVGSAGSQAINARSETVSQKAFFRHLVNRRRCVVVMDGFFEWKKFEVLGQPRRQAYFVRPNPVKSLEGAAEATPQPLLYLAGLWDVWQPQGSGEKLVTCTILTTEATAEFAGIHDRMPVVLQPEDVEKWLDTDNFKFDQLRHLLAPYKGNGLTWYEVTDKVNSVKNKSAENIEPLELHKAKGIGRFFAKPKAGENTPVSETKTPVGPLEDNDDVIVVGGKTLTPPRPEGTSQKSPAKKQKKNRAATWAKTSDFILQMMREWCI